MFLMWGGDVATFRLHWPAFLFAFCIGIFYVYVTDPPREVVVKYPTPFNVGHVTYEDKTHTCFTFEAKRGACPEDKRKIKEQPIVM